MPGEEGYVQDSQANQSKDKGGREELGYPLTLIVYSSYGNQPGLGCAEVVPQSVAGRSKSQATEFSQSTPARYQ